MIVPQVEDRMVRDFNKALKYLNNNKPEKALSLFKAIEKAGNPFKEVYLNIGTCYKNLDDDNNAAKFYLLANDTKTPYTDGKFINKGMPAALYNLALLASSYEQEDVAEKLYREALVLEPDYNLSKWGLANTLLKQYCSKKLVNPTEAWLMYHARFSTEDRPTNLYVDRDIKLWNCRDYVDSLVILTEQGMGDFLMFGRFIPYMKRFCNKLYIQCHSKLVPLFPEYTCITNVSETDATHAVPVGSIAAAFPGSIPDGEWLSHLNVPKERGEKLQIGVVWSGSKTHANTKHRNTTPAQFKRLSKYADLYTLNPTEHGEKGFHALRGETMYDTAMNINKLDLVITIDTSVAHLCGAMGKECWVLLGYKSTDWRWGDSSMGYDNVWYKSLRIFRNDGNWIKVFDEVEAQLAQRSSEKII